MTCTPKVRQKTFGVFVMSKKKKHGYDELLRYMHLLEKGYSACSIHQQYGIVKSKYSTNNFQKN